MKYSTIQRFSVISFSLALFLGFSLSYDSNNFSVNLEIGQEANARSFDDQWGIANIFWYSVEETISSDDDLCIAEAETTVVGNTCSFWVSYCSETIHFGEPKQIGEWLCFE